MTPATPRVSVVIPTYERLDACMRAVSSALQQEISPLEVLICDHGSADDTQGVLQGWARDEPLLRYLRLPHNYGTPAPARNLGIERARGEWVAFLDDDDQWVPTKLRVQSEAVLAGHYDVVASDAMRVSGDPYFGLERAVEPDRAEMLRHNPIITSTAVVRRSCLTAMGGFRTSGVEDYATWLRLAYRDARFLVLPDQLVIYDDTGDQRLSRAVARQEAGVAAVRWRLWMEQPTDGALLLASLRATADAARHRLRALRPSRRERAD